MKKQKLSTGEKLLIGKRLTAEMKRNFPGHNFQAKFIEKLDLAGCPISRSGLAAICSGTNTLTEVRASSFADILGVSAEYLLLKTNNPAHTKRDLDAIAQKKQRQEDLFSHREEYAHLYSLVSAYTDRIDFYLSDDEGNEYSMHREKGSLSDRATKQTISSADNTFTIHIPEDTFNSVVFGSKKIILEDKKISLNKVVIIKSGKFKEYSSADFLKMIQLIDNQIRSYIDFTFAG